MTEPETMTKMAPFWEQKLGLCQRYLKLTHKLKAAVSAADVKAMSEFAEKRRQCADQIDGVDRAITRYRDPVTGLWRGATEKLNGRIARYHDAISTILRSVAGLERELMPVAVGTQQRLKSELLNKRHARKATQRYYGGGVQAPRFIDTSS